MASRSRSTEALLAALLLTGCAENAILEIDIVPPSPESAHTLAVQVSSIDADETTAVDLGTEVYQFPLANLAGDPTHISVEARSEETFGRPLGIAVWTCQEEACADIVGAGADLVLYRVERAFHLGQRTHLDLDVSRDLMAPPSEIVDVSKCRVRGCGVADSSYCYVDAAGEERHFCER